MALPKKVKKTLNMYPVVRNQPHYPSGYDGMSTPKRRKQLEEFISKDGTFLPKSVLHEDLDLGMLDFVKERLRIQIDGKSINFIDQILTVQRWAEFSNTWSFVDDDRQVDLPFLVVVRQPDPQYGTNPALNYTIPDRRAFHYAKVPTWDGQRKGMDLYKIPQPVPIDISYDIKIVCNRMRELNHFNKVMLQTFTSRQAYTFVKGHYIPIIMQTISDESQLSNLEKRRFYNQNYNLQLQGFLIDGEEFEVTPAISRSIVLTEVDTRTKKRKSPPTEENPEGPFTEVVCFASGTTASATAIISGGSVTGITVDITGSGYSSVPSVTLLGGGIPAISAATATAVVTNKSVTSIDVTFMGSGYTSTPTVEIGPPQETDGSKVFMYNGNLQIIEMTNITSCSITIDGVNTPAAKFTVYYVLKGQTLAFNIVKIDPYKESCLTFSVDFN
tara:strand:- start:8011 stop:9339 length:1329 start_codon:yes stop_codon:yes gene_type:complete